MIYNLPVFCVSDCTMSCQYTRVAPKPVPIKLYGFNKVTGREMSDILQRLQRGTYNSQVCQDTRPRYRSAAQRPPSVLCYKADLEGDEAYRKRPRTAASPQQLTQMTRRLLRPTKSALAARGKITPAYEVQLEEERARIAENSQHLDHEERAKVMERVLRPTTSTRRRQPCALARELEGAEEPDIPRDQPVQADQLDAIVQRLGSATYCSKQGGKHACPRKYSTPIGLGQRTDIPLMSGLKRSSGVSEITDRLYRPTACRPIYRHNATPAATRTTPYC